MNEESVLTPEEAAIARQRRLEAVVLQAIEANPLTPHEIAMFEMFERELWPHSRRRAYILAQITALAAE